MQYLIKMDKRCKAPQEVLGLVWDSNRINQSRQSHGVEGGSQSLTQPQLQQIEKLQ